MGVSNLFYALPKAFADQLRNDPDLAGVFEQIYGCGSSLEAFFKETDTDEIEEIVEDCSVEAVGKMKDLIEQADFGKSAYIEGTYLLHKEGIKNYLSVKGATNADVLVLSLMSGDISELDDEFSRTDDSNLQLISELLSDDVGPIISQYTFEGADVDSMVQSIVKRELQDILDCVKSVIAIKGELWSSVL